ncbi:MAG: hypothetical protein EBR82_59510 [Caulobacteraceae bacterium]|nr:hypothetical protein [Caulobacteraceae bacterium]
MAFTVDIRGNASHLEKTLNSAKGSISSLGSVASAGVASITALGAAGAAGIAAFVASSSNAAMNIEVMTMQFATLLGGADAAGKRMEEIIKFAASTPFEIPELVATSKLLQTLGGTMLATGEGLRMVGDAAAISGQPLEEVGRHIGRVFNAITTGNSAGESVARLQELGLIGGEVKREFENLAAAQKKGKVASLTSAQAMAKLKGVFKQTEGAMLALSSTTSGKLSNMKDNIGKLQVAFGKGFNDGFRDALDAANNFLPQLEDKFTEVGDIIGSAITQAISGNTAELAAVGGFLGDIVFAGFKAVYMKGMDELLAGAQNAVMVDPTGFRSFSNLLSEKTALGPKYDLSPKVESASLASYMQTAMEEVGQSQNLQTLKNAEMQRQVEFGIKNGIDSSMSEAVKKGILEAWSRQPTGAKFTN